ncbi:MAG: tape measure protein [Actinomycetota bacterium]
MKEQEEILEQLAQQLASGEISAEDYRSRVEELLSAARVGALQSAGNGEDDSPSSVAEDRIKSAARKARSY